MRGGDKPSIFQIRATRVVGHGWLWRAWGLGYALEPQRWPGEEATGVRGSDTAQSASADSNLRNQGVELGPSLLW